MIQTRLPCTYTTFFVTALNYFYDGRMGVGEEGGGAYSSLLLALVI